VEWFLKMAYQNIMSFDDLGGRVCAGSYPRTPTAKQNHAFSWDAVVFILLILVASFMMSTWQSRTGIRFPPFATALLMASIVRRGVILSSWGMPFVASVAWVASQASGTEVWLNVFANSRADVVESELVSIGYLRISKLAVKA
jgi:hypothetical protein